MECLKRAKATAALSRKAEEFLYERALDEYESGEIRRGLWAQALAKAQGDEARAKGVYLKLRVRAMMDDGAIVDQFEAESSRAQAPTPKPAAHRQRSQAQTQESVDNPGSDFGVLGIILLLFVAGSLAVGGLFYVLQQ